MRILIILLLGVLVGCKGNKSSNQNERDDKVETSAVQDLMETNSLSTHELDSFCIYSNKEFEQLMLDIPLFAPEISLNGKFSETSLRCEKCEDDKALDWFLLEDKNGVSIKYHDSLNKPSGAFWGVNADVFYKGKLYTGKVKQCKNERVWRLFDYIEGKRTGNYVLYNEFAMYLDGIGKVENGLISVIGEVSVEDTTRINTFYSSDYETQKNYMVLKFGDELEYSYYNESPRYLEWIAIKSNGQYHGVKKEYDNTGAVKSIRIYFLGKEVSCKGDCN